MMDSVDRQGAKLGVLKVGLCGLGRAANGLLTREIAHVPDVKVVAAFDVLPERSAALAAKIGCRVHASFQELLADAEVELVVVQTRSIDHVAMAKEALASGKHVLLEKPMAINLAGVDELLKAAAGAKGRLFIRHNRRFEPGFLLSREIIASGKLGDVFQINIRQHKYQARNDWQTIKQFGGGQLLNWGPHVIDWGMRLLGSPLADQWSDLKRVISAGDAEDHVKLMLRGTNGRVIDIEISDAVAVGQPSWVLYGSRGTMMIHGEVGTLKYLDPSVKIELTAETDTPSATGGYAGPAKLHWIDEAFAVSPTIKIKLIQAVYNAIKLGEPFPITLEQAKANIEVIEKTRVGTAFEIA